jgi:hypothetical protein
MVLAQENGVQREKCDHAVRVKVTVSLWPVALAMRYKVVVEGRLPAFSSRAILACAVLSFTADSV